MAEGERCLAELGFKALAVDTSYGTADGVFPHTPEAFDFWDFVEDRGVAVYVHPAMLPYGWEWMDRYKFDETVARPAETALRVSLMIMSGLFDRFPGLKIVLAHMGGAFPMILPRLRFGHRLGYDGFPAYQRPKNLREPADYVRENLWANSMGFDPAGIRHAIEVFGLDHVLLGTDYGPVPISPREHIDMIVNDLGLSVHDQDRILGLNAQALFGPPDPV